MIKTEIQDDKSINSFVGNIYQMDNKTLMESMPKESIDLIYIDPPFGIKADEKFGMTAWKKTNYFDQSIYTRFSDILNENDLKYLSWLRPRLILMRELLSETGSIYVHLDWHLGHYVKIVMDEVFGKASFLNHITWKRYAAHSLASDRYDSISDEIYFYSKTNKKYLDMPFEKLSDIEIKNRFPHYEVETGRSFQHAALEKSANIGSRGEIRIIDGKSVTTSLGWVWSQETFNERLNKNPYLIYWTDKGRPRYKIYADEYKGAPLGNIWTDIGYLSAGDSERVNYATQKPEKLLERIIKASCPEGGLVADFNGGSGTTAAVAERLGRRWITTDISEKACAVIEKRILNQRGEL